MKATPTLAMRHRGHDKTQLSSERPASAPIVHGAPLHRDLWLALTVENWLLDFARPLYGLYVSSIFPLSLPGIGDYCHMAYNVITAVIMLRLLERSSRPVPRLAQQLLAVVFVMGASIHLVGDSVQHRLLHSGYKLHLSVRDNPIMKSLKPATLVESFELLYFYDEVLGHWMWYLPLFVSYVVCFFGSFSLRPCSSSTFLWALLLPSALFEWYMVTEGQIFPLFLAMLLAMGALTLWRWRQGLAMDLNAQFLLYRALATLLLVAVWVLWLWDDAALRTKYPGLLYVPEPWSYVSLYIMN